MRRLVLGLALLASLGCAGMGEKIFEVTTGGSIEITEEGMVMTLPDGSEVTSVTGEEARRPDDFPLPPPWDGAKVQALTRTVRPDGVETVLLSYELDHPKVEIFERYRAALAAAGVEGEHEEKDAMGTHIETLKGTLPDGREVSVMTTEAFGSNSLTVAVGPLDDR